MISSTCGSLRLVGPSALHMILDWRAPLQGHKDQPPPQGRPAPGLAPQGSNQTQTSAFSLDVSAKGRQANSCTSVLLHGVPNIGQILPGVNQADGDDDVAAVNRATEWTGSGRRRGCAEPYTKLASFQVQEFFPPPRTLSPVATHPHHRTQLPEYPRCFPATTSAPTLLNKRAVAVL